MKAKPRPAALRLPAEWEPHEATLLAWPVNTRDWPGKFQPIPWVFAEMVRQISREERVWLIVPSDAVAQKARRILERAHACLDRVHFLELELDRGWMRDCSPAFVLRKDGKQTLREAVHFAFNAWAKYPNWQRDALAAPFLAKYSRAKRVPAKLGKRHVVLEGGAIDSNGAGTLLTTEECLLDPVTQVRNPGFTREDYEAVFREHLGITQVIWLGHGIAGDDTHGHVDDLCRFVDATTVVLCQEPNTGDANHRALAENAERLQGMRNATGEKLRVVALPMPAPLYFDSLRLPASYANFYIGNEAVLVPTFNDTRDREALGILGELFPDRRVVGIHAVDLVWGFGTIHCLTHEIPAP
ncbi:MAG: agmatine deiminase family protein [Candidatus Hydrogenedentes bacterium]|nr:agmatine deiminase family protein [Candidatus Hydrogenedentota bacterium]